MRSTCRLLVVLCVWFVATGVAAGPAAIAPAEAAASRAEVSFDAFAGHWMGRALARGERERRAPRAQTSSKGMFFTYRTVAGEFETELRPTGRPRAPYVGVLRYTEHTFTCEDLLGSRCRISSSLPVTEVFRYRAGRWGY